MPHSGRPFRAYAFPLSPEKSLIFWTALIQNGQLFIRAGGMGLLLPHLPTLGVEIFIAICKFTTLGTTFFSACGGILRCRAQVDRQKHGKFPNSPRNPFFASSRNATLNEEHCVTKHKTAAKTVNRDFTTIEVEVFITLFA